MPSLIFAKVFLVSFALLALAACGGGDGYGGGGGGGGTSTYTVGGMVSGLTGSGLTLRDNGGDNLAVSATGSFTFAAKVATGAAYSVTVYTQPTNPSQTCTVTNGSGTMGSGNVTNVSVTCTTSTYTVGGTVTGLTGLGLVLRDNGGDNLSVSTAGAFTFATAVASGMPYNVTVFTQPANPNQNCATTNGTGSGTVTNANVTTVTVVCVNVGRFAYVANSASNTVSVYTIDATTGALTSVGGPVATGTKPQLVTVDPSGKFAYVANSGSNNVSAYTTDATTGALTAVAGSPFATGTTGSTPHAVTVHPNGKFAYVANDGDDSISAYAIDVTTGTLTLVVGSPFATGASVTASQSVTIDPSGKFAYVANQAALFARGTVSAFTINATTGALTAVPGSPFAAGVTPYVVSVDPSGKFAYVANAGMGSAVPGTVSAFTINATTGALTPVAGSPFAAGVNGINAYAVTVDPSGKFAYVANTGSNSIAAYTIDASTGALAAVAGSPFAAGTLPAIVTVDPSGKFAYVANGGASIGSPGTVSAFTINASSGVLTSVAGSPFAAGTSPQSVSVDPGGRFAYVANFGAFSSNPGNVSAYSIDTTTGALTASVGSPFAAGTNPLNVTVVK